MKALNERDRSWFLDLCYCTIRDNLVGGDQIGNAEIQAHTVDRLVEMSAEPGQTDDDRALLALEFTCAKNCIDVLEYSAPIGSTEEIAIDAVKYALDRVQRDPDFHYFCGWGTETFERFCRAEAAATGKTFEEVEEQRGKFLRGNIYGRFEELRRWKEGAEKHIQHLAEKHGFSAGDAFDDIEGEAYL